MLPLSPNLGLIQWCVSASRLTDPRVPTCDTLHSLIREQRERSAVALNLEVRLMMQCAAEYERLTIIQVGL